MFSKKKRERDTQNRIEDLEIKLVKLQLQLDKFVEIENKIKSNIISIQDIVNKTNDIDIASSLVIENQGKDIDRIVTEIKLIKSNLINVNNYIEYLRQSFIYKIPDNLTILTISSFVVSGLYIANRYYQYI